MNVLTPIIPIATVIIPIIKLSFNSSQPFWGWRIICANFDTIRTEKLEDMQYEHHDTVYLIFIIIVLRWFYIFSFEKSYRVKLQISAEPIVMASHINVVGLPVLANLYSTPSIPSVGGFSVRDFTYNTCISSTITEVLIFHIVTFSFFFFLVYFHKNSIQFWLRH